MIDPNSFDTSGLGQYDFGAAIDASNISSLTKPAATTNGAGPSNGNVISNVTKGILDLFDNGFAVYQKVNAITGGSASRTAVEQQQQQAAQVAAAGNPVAFGLNQTQLLWIAGGLGVVLLISMTARKA